MNQPKDVWFLAGTFGGTAERTCHIPLGQPIYFPIINSICEVPEGAVGKRALERCTPYAQRSSARLDGEPLTVRAATSRGSFPFEASAASRIASPGTFQAVAGGMWVGPLTVAEGQHVLRFSAAGSFTLSVVYHLTVR